MLNSCIENILKRQNYIENLSDQQISTIKTKEIFLKAYEDSSLIDQQKHNSFEEQRIFRSGDSNGPINNLMRKLNPVIQNSYEEIEKLQLGMRLFDQKRLNQFEIIKSQYEKQKQEIRASGLKVKDFMDIYQSEQMQNEQKDLSNPLVKKIISYFQFGSKESQLYELLESIIQEISTQTPQQSIHQQQMEQIRKKIYQQQGLNPDIQQQNQFNSQTKKQMDKTIELYQNTLQIFDIQNHL